MKNKKLLYILIPTVILIWGAVVYKIYSATHGSDNNSLVMNTVVLSKAEVNEISDTFSIHPDLRDPFKGKFKKVSSSGDNSATPVKPKITEIKSVVSQFPKVVYSGMIKNQKSNKQLVLIQINGQGNTMKVGDEISGVQLTKVFRDSIEVKFGKEKMFVRK